MVKSHRSSSTLFNTWANHEPPAPLSITRETVNPDSPSRSDPFSSDSRPPSIVTPTTPTIILASPSTSTIHYLFPTSDTRTHLSVSDRPLTRSQSTVSRQHPVLPASRSSFDQSEKQRSDERKTFENAFPIPPSRHNNQASQKSQNILGAAKRISSVSSSGSIRRSENSKPLLNSPPKCRSTHTTGHAPMPRMSQGQPDVAGSHRQLRGRSIGKEGNDGSKQKESTSLREKGSRRELHTTIEPIIALDAAYPTKLAIVATRGKLPQNTCAPATTPKALRRRSRSLTAASPNHSILSSPILPKPDFGDSLSSSILPSPSFSHLDYSTAGASITRRDSGVTSLFSKNGSAIFPTSTTMTRGDTRTGLGSYSSGKDKAREDVAQRLNGEGRVAFIRRSVSLKRSDDKGGARPRSLSFSAKSIRELGISSPLQVPGPSVKGDAPSPDRGIGLGDKSVDFGGRYGSPASADSSIFPIMTPSSGCVSSPVDEVRIVSRPLHPAFTSVGSTYGLGVTANRSRVSPRERLEEAMDLHDEKRSFCSILSAEETSQGPKLSDAVPSPSARDRGPRRSLLLEQNTFFIPPQHPRPSLRTSKSMGSSTMRRAFTSATLRADARGSTISPRTRSDVKYSPEIRSPPCASPTTGFPPPSSPSMRFRRPITGFSLCSPPNAIDPLPYMLPCTMTGDRECQSPKARGTRSNKSSPFMSSSSSFQVIFGKDGFVARSLTQAFDAREKSSDPTQGSDIKRKISDPLAASRTGVTNAAHIENLALHKSTLTPVVSLSFPKRCDKLAEPCTINLPSLDHCGSYSRFTESHERSSPAIICDRSESQHLEDIGQAMLSIGNSIESGLNLRSVNVNRFIVPNGVPPVRKGTERTDGAQERIADSALSPKMASSSRDSRRFSISQTIRSKSRWSPVSATKKELLRKSSLPNISRPFGAVFPTQPSPQSCTPPTPPLPDSSHLRTPAPNAPKLSPSRSRLFDLLRNRTPKAPTSPLPSSPSSFSLSLRQSRSRSPRTIIDSSNGPISSSSLPPPRLSLDKLDLSVNVDDGGRKEEKVNKVLAWRSDVGNHEGLSRLEDLMARHVEREREALRGIAEAASPRRGI